MSAVDESQLNVSDLWSCWLVVLVGWEEGGGQAPASQLSLALTALTNTDLSAALLDS